MPETLCLSEFSGPILVSACLCGEICRYDAKDAGIPFFKDLWKRGLAIPVCPEVLGGLPVPRDPCEIAGNRVLDTSGLDRTEAFRLGAEKTLCIAKEHGIAAAVLKERSPSCGVTRIYDGTFGSRTIPGRGVTASLLAANGFAVFSEETFPFPGETK